MHCPAFSVRHLKPVTHCIFDLDGLLLDSEPRYSESIAMLLAPFGKVMTPAQQLECMGRGSSETAEQIVRTFKLPYTPQEFTALHRANCAKLLQNVPLLSGVRRLLRHLHNSNVPMAIGTSSSLRSYTIKSKPHTELFKVFNHVVCGGSDPEVKRCKPAPDIFLVAASRFNEQPKPQCCLVFEDSINGMKAALSAGMQVVLVPSPYLPMEARAAATLCLHSMDCFKPQYFGLPPL